MPQDPRVYPSLEEVTSILETSTSSPSTLAPPSDTTYPSTSAPTSSHPHASGAKPNLVPVYQEIPADLLTPVAAYLKVAGDSKHSFLLESVVAGENLARYSFVGAGELIALAPIVTQLISDPVKTVRTGEGFDVTGDPLAALEKELEVFRYAKLNQLPTFTGELAVWAALCIAKLIPGGAVGFITYDAIAHFEPVTKPASPLDNPIPGLPEAFFMVTSTLIIFDHTFQTMKIVTHVHLPDGVPSTHVKALYEEAVARLDQTRRKLQAEHVPLPPQGPIKLGHETKSNVGKAGYEGFVTNLKEHIKQGNIIQAVPSQRLSRPTQLHPFNIYRHLRRLNPSPYMFYLNCGDVQIVGASPETLCKVEDRKVYNHAIAGTVRRGKTLEGE